MIKSMNAVQVTRFQEVDALNLFQQQITLEKFLNGLAGLYFAGIGRPLVLLFLR